MADKDKTAETATAASAVAVTPPPVRRGRQAAPIDADLLKGMRELLSSGQWVGDGKRYDDKPKANKAIADYKRALKDDGVSQELTSRTWEEGDAIRIAIGVKG